MPEEFTEADFGGPATATADEFTEADFEQKPFLPPVEELAGPIPRDPLERAALNRAELIRSRMSTVSRPEEQFGAPTTLPGGVVLEGEGPIPRITPPKEAGLIEKAAAGTLNVAGSIPNFIMSPEGVVTMAIPELLPAKYAKPLLKGVFSGLMAKGAGEAAGKASVTKDPQDIVEAIESAALTGVPYIEKRPPPPEYVTGRVLRPPATGGTPTSIGTTATPGLDIIQAREAQERMLELGRQATMRGGLEAVRGQLPPGQEMAPGVEPTTALSPTAEAALQQALGTPPPPIVPRGVPPPAPRSPPAPPAPSPVVRVVPPGSVPPSAVVPAIRLIGGEVVKGRPGDTHPDIIARHEIAADEIDQRGFWFNDAFHDREATAQGTGIVPQREPGRLHSTDLPAAKSETPPVQVQPAAEAPPVSKRGTGTLTFIGTRFRGLMDELGVSEAQVAKEMGVSIGRVREALKGTPREGETWNDQAIKDWEDGIKRAWQQPTEAPPAAPEPAAGAKEPWQMTRDEFASSDYYKRLRSKMRRIKESPGSVHVRLINAARDRGEPVPPEVLADYPDLAKPAAPPPAPEAAAAPTPTPPEIAPAASVVLNRGNVETTATPAITSASPKGGFNAKQAKQQKKFLLDAANQAMKSAPDVAAGQWQNPELQAEWTRAQQATEGRPERYQEGKFLSPQEYEIALKPWEDARSEKYRDLFEKYNIPKESPASTPYLDIAGEMQQARKAEPLSFGDRIGLLKEAITKANHELLPKITIQVPGDGEFTVENNRSVIRSLIKRAEEGEWFGKGEERFKAGPFPTTAPRVSEPKGVRATPTAAAALGKMDSESATDAAALHVSDDPGREVLHYIWSDGKQTVAVDGRKLVRIQKGLGGTEAKPKLFTTEGEPLSAEKAKELKFPDWKQVVPENVPLIAKGLDTQKLFTLLVQAEHVVSERSNSVKLWKNKDGSIGITANTPEVGSYEGNIKPGAELLAAVNPVYLRDIINSARKVGIEKIDLHATDELSPIVVKAPGFEGIQMPMRLESRITGEPAGLGMSDAQISDWLRREHGVDINRGAVEIVNEPGSRTAGAFVKDKFGNIVGIRINSALIDSPGKLAHVWNEEVAHWFHNENKGFAESLVEKLSDQERADIDAGIRRAGYDPDKVQIEQVGKGIAFLADQWRNRSWFGRLAGEILTWANERLGLRLTRRAAENLAARALARTVRGVAEFKPNAINEILRMSPDDFANWKRDTLYGRQRMLQLADQATPRQIAQLTHQRDLIRSAVQRGLRQARELPAAQRDAAVNRLLKADVQAQTFNEIIENARPGELVSAESRLPAAAQKSADFVREVRDEEFKAPKMTPLRRSVLNWSAKLQRSFGESEKAQRDIVRRVRDPIRRDAITNWIQADGDPTVLASRRADTAAWRDPNTGKPHPDAKRLVAGYDAALNLTPEEIAVANEVRQRYADFETRGQAANVLQSHKDNYVTQIWNLRKGPSGGGVGRTLKERFRFAKASTFPTFFDGEQAGFVPKTKDISKLLPVYMHEMESVIAGRELVAEMARGKASDGRPLIAPKGTGVPVSGPEGEATLVNPKVSTENTRDYRVLPDQPALSKWRWVSEDTDGNPIFLKADLALHPEAFRHLRAVLGRSAIRDWYGTRTGAIAEIPKAIVHGLDAWNAITKRTMLGMVATFHQVQEGFHALGHRVNPSFSIPEVDIANKPEQMDAARHGLMLNPDKASESQFMEGFSTSGLVRKLPGIGPISEWYGNQLFRKYIPGLKFKTYSHIIDRNMRLYAKELARGEVTESDVKILSAEQANAAFGHLNYADLGRNPTVQHFAQLALLAPDFLEARARFAGQAIKGLTGAKVGREQLVALATLAVVQAAAAYTVAKLTGGEWDKKRPFEFTKGARRYTLRSVPEDTLRLMTDTRQFVHNRLSPIIGKGALQYATGVDYRGAKTTAAKTTKELALQPIPISVRGFLGIGSSPLSGLEQLAGSVGLKISRYSPAMDVHQMVRTWAENNPDPKIKAAFEQREASVFPHVYGTLHNFLAVGNMRGAQSAYNELLKIKTPAQIKEAMGRDTPFSGSKPNELKFVRSLSADQRKLYEAAKAERKAIYQRFLRLSSRAAAPATPTPATPPPFDWNRYIQPPATGP